MDINLFQTDFVLSLPERQEIITRLGDLNRKHPYCSACSSSVDIGFMRKLHDEPAEVAMCLPCFLHNNTNHDQEDIDKLVELAAKRGWYYD